jgi:hypothetical protein
MKFLFIIGVEGAGHEMLRALMQEVIRQPYFVLEGSWRNMMTHYWSPKARYRSEHTSLRKMTRQKLQDKLQSFIIQYGNKGVTHFMEDMSFPFNQPRNAICRPDILDFIDLISDQAELKILVLYRNPVSATYSSLRRGFTKNVFEQARIIEDNLIYIDKHLSICDKSLYRTLIFEEFLINPLAYLKGLANWFELDYSLLLNGVKNLRPPFNSDAIPEKIRITLLDFFTENRSRLWQTLYSKDQKIIAY